jgi:hypothetical protein
MISPAQVLDLLMLLSAMETHALAHKNPYPPHLSENLNSLVSQLRYELLGTAETNLVSHGGEPR